MYQDIEALSVAYYQDQSTENRQALVLGCVPLVRSIMNRLRIPKEFLATYEDLQGVGLLGLLEAMERYDPTQGVRFTSYAYSRIRGGMVDYLRMIDVLPRERREELARAQRAIETLRQQQGNEPEDREVAAFLGISLEAYYTLMRDAQFRHTLSLRSTATENKNEATLESIPNEEADLPFTQIDWNSDREYIDVLIKRLSEREQRILTYYYEDNLTLREIAVHLGVSEARISQILNKTLRHLRRCLDEPRAAA